MKRPKKILNRKQTLFMVQSVLLICIIIVFPVLYVGLANERNHYRDLAFEAGNAYEQLRAVPTQIGDFTLSNTPGIFNFEFNLQVTHNNPNARIYYTIDGTEPSPGSRRRINGTTVNGRIGDDGQIVVRDRSSRIRSTILSRHTQTHALRGRPARGVDIPAGTTFKFRAFAFGTPIGETITATYIVWRNFAQEFDGVPVISITAPYNNFVELYWDNVRSEDPVRHVYHYEFFEHNGTSNRYERKFNMPGSTQLGGGRGSRARPQRVFNVHMARGDLDGHITHEVFEGLNDLTRFRLWNNSNNFWRCLMREPFAQKAAYLAGMNVIHSDYRLAMKFINGEFWGFTTIREHTSNNFFTSARLGIEPRNRTAIIDFSDIWGPMAIDIQEAAGGRTQKLYDDLRAFVISHDLTQDVNIDRLFDEFFCIENTIDYIITRTFFDTGGWFDNTRIVRAVYPDTTSNNPNMDGRWRFILNDFDGAIPTHHNGNSFNRIFTTSINMVPNIIYRQILNNPTFVQQFVDRANELMTDGLDKESLVELFEYMRDERLVLLPAHFNRFSMTNSRTVSSSLANFNYHTNIVHRFITNRHAYYQQHLNWLLERVS